MQHPDHKPQAEKYNQEKAQQTGEHKGFQKKVVHMRERNGEIHKQIGNAHQLIAEAAHKNSPGRQLQRGDKGSKDLAPLGEIGDVFAQIPVIREVHTGAVSFGCGFAEQKGRHIAHETGRPVKALKGQRDEEGNAQNQDGRFLPQFLQREVLQRQQHGQHGNADRTDQFHCPGENQRNGHIEQQPRQDNGNTPPFVPAGKKLIDHHAQSNVEPQGGYGTVGVENIDIMNMPGFVKTEKYILRRQINVGIQQINHNGQGAGNKVKNAYCGAETVQEPAAPIPVQHGAQAQHSGAEKTGQHQVWLPGHPVVPVEETSGHKPQGIAQDQVHLKSAPETVMEEKQGHERNQ